MTGFFLYVPSWRTGLRRNEEKWKWADKVAAVKLFMTVFTHEFISRFEQIDLFVIIIILSHATDVN